ncbi:radical SAM family heme chaperone HemW [Spiroplasma alleghenense]|uniref:Heme chaperone HemW n=1 Tax=Spiroplasma alleghenense TaxID=216931 RepID=A0A345Z394_9MOLU|nr:radical SAM family heme chaperone HemW [Spiroplasma alleghenense]AXK51073.1 coproporphyrinogen III oxidase [Spiroplasma alleghenense]
MTNDELITKDVKSLYVHIPFCDSICFFCDFVKVKKTSDEQVWQYLEKLEQEIESYRDDLGNLETIYIGGGTPSCLNEECTLKMLQILHPFVKENIEYTIEINPEKVSENKLELYKKFGVNRLSIGIQTFSNPLLKKIGRIHDNLEPIRVIELARKIGFENISIDLIYNLFEQNKDDILVDIEKIKELKPDHISWYSLILKENSIWGKLKKKLPENDEYFDEIINSKLIELGYCRYEVSNYSLNNKISLHNLSYWNNQRFIGVGIGAAGFIEMNNNLYLTKNEGNINHWERIDQLLSQKEYYFQIIMMGLRLVDGIDFSKVRDGALALDYFQSELKIHFENKLLELTDNGFKCTPRGYEIMDNILLDII